MSRAGLNIYVGRVCVCVRCAVLYRRRYTDSLINVVFFFSLSLSACEQSAIG